MYKRNLEFPYPLLSVGTDDYVGCEFAANVDMEKVRFDKESLIIPVHYKLNCSDIDELIVDEKAVVCVLVVSTATAYRRSFRFDKNSTFKEIKIPKYSVADKVELSCTITSTQAIKNFSSKYFNQVYFNGAIFTIRNGDVIAQSLMETIYLNDTELEKPLSSIFYVTHLENSDEDMRYSPSFEEEKIKIVLAEETYKVYTELKEFNYGVLRRFLASVIVMPALAEAIEVIKKNENSENEVDPLLLERRWYKAICKKFIEKKIDITSTSVSSAELANTLLGDVVKDALSGIQDTIDDITDKGSVTPLGGMD